jgi:hypothetical protein
MTMSYILIGLVVGIIANYLFFTLYKFVMRVFFSNEDGHYSSGDVNSLFLEGESERRENDDHPDKNRRGDY